MLNVGKQDFGKGSEGIGVSKRVAVPEKGLWKGHFTMKKFIFDEAQLDPRDVQLRQNVDRVISNSKILSKALLISEEELLEKIAKQYCKDMQNVDIGYNILLNEGINEMLTLLAGGSATAFNNANSYMGVGDSTTAESAAHTGLQAASNKLYVAMDASYPTYGTSQQIVFRATFGSSQANFAWQEFTVANGNSDAAKNLNRKVSAQGTKTSGQTWQPTLTVTIT